MHPDGLAFRASLLLSAAGICFHGNSVLEFYTVLQPHISKARLCSELNGSAETSCCSDCIGIGDFNYNVFLGMAYFMGVLSVPLGFLLDKFGNSVSIFIVTCAVTGTSVIALGSSLSPSRWTLPLMFVGAAVYGIGHIPSFSTRDRLVGFWFKEKNLRLAFGVSSTVSRIAAILSFSLTERLRELVGLQLTMWVAVMACVLSLICVICASLLDAHGNRQLGRTDEIKREASQVSGSDVKHASAEYWLLLFAFTFSSGSTFTYMENSVEFVNEKFGFTKSQAALISGTLHFIGIVGSPAAGILIDKVGHSSLFCIGASSSLMLGISLLAFTPAHPVIGAVLIGIVFCFIHPAIYASVPLVVPRASLGLFTSLLFFADSMTIMLLHSLVGRILGSELKLSMSVKLHRWTLAMSSILATACVSLAFAVAVHVTSRRRNSVLSTSPGAQYEKISGDSRESNSNEDRVRCSR